MQLFLRQAETCVFLPVRSHHCVRADFERGRIQARPAQLQQTWPCRHRKRARPWASGQARGLLIPCFNLTSIIRMPDSASDVKIVLVRGQRSSPFVETSMGRRIFPGLFQRSEAAGAKKEARPQRDMQLSTLYARARLSAVWVWSD